MSKKSLKEWCDVEVIAANTDNRFLRFLSRWEPQISGGIMGILVIAILEVSKHQ